jgi:hypothetical protein
LLIWDEFQCSWIRIRIPNPDPHPGQPPNQCGSGSTTLQATVTGLRIRIRFIRSRFRIRIQDFRLKTDPDPGPIRIRIQSGSRALMTKNWKKIKPEKKIKKNFGSKTPIYLSLCLLKERPSNRRSLQLSKKRPYDTSKHKIFSIFFYFCESFLPSWVRIH